MDRNIQKLLERFYDGKTTTAEEEKLYIYFKEDNIPEELGADKELFLSLYNTDVVEVPIDLKERLSQTIDSLDARNSEKKRIHLTYSVKWFTGISAVVLMLFIMQFYNGKESVGSKRTEVFADTYTDPNEARVKVEETLLFVSTKMNRGVDELNTANARIEKANEIINKNLQ